MSYAKALLGPVASSHHRSEVELPSKPRRWLAISHAVWLYYRYCLSFRDVEDLLAARGIIVSSGVRSIKTAT